MATVDGKTSIKIDELLSSVIVNGYISAGGHLILVKENDAEIDAGAIDSKRNEQWLHNAPYVSGDIIGYAGRSYRAKLANTNKCPAFYSSYWTMVIACDSEQWVEVDPDFNADSLTENYSTFWANNNPTVSMTTVVGEYETGIRGVKVDVPISGFQRIIPRLENLVRVGEVIEVTVRARLSSLVSGATLNVAVIQNDEDNLPEPFVAGAVYSTAIDAAQALTTSWATYKFRFTMLADRPRAKIHLVFTGSGSSASTFFVDRWHVRRLSTVDQLMDKMYPVGSIWMTEETDDANNLFYGTWVRYAEGTTLVGQDSGDTDFDTGGETGGSKTKTIAVANLPAHTHDATHTHTLTRSDAVGSSNANIPRGTTTQSSSGTGGIVAFTGNTGSTGSGTALDVMNPYTVVYIWKRTA